MSILITIYRNKLVYDIDAISWKVARCRIPQPTPNQAEVQTDSNSDNKFVVERQIVYAINAVKQFVKWCEQSSTQSGSNDLSVNTEGAYTLTFREPQGWRSDGNQIAALVNHYIVTRVLADWFEQVMPKEVEAYKGRADSILSELIHLFVRDAPVFPETPEPEPEDTDGGASQGPTGGIA